MVKVRKGRPTISERDSKNRILSPYEGNQLGRVARMWLDNNIRILSHVARNQYALPKEISLKDEFDESVELTYYN